MSASWEGELDRLGALLHDLRTPLAAILGLALTLEREDVTLQPDEAKELSSRIAANARTLDRMVGDLLDLQRMGRGLVELISVEADVGEVVTRSVEDSDSVRRRTVLVDAEIVTADVDPAKVGRIVENLLSNSVRHTPSQSRVWVRVRREDGGALIAVEDEGPGVPVALRTAIFEPFRQGPATSEHSPGAGIGLALVAAFAELHGGRAWVEDREGGGASFRVWLPGRSNRSVEG
ncbi:MAG: sensor histidine kinase [Actinomycetota bacterium]